MTWAPVPDGSDFTLANLPYGVIEIDGIREVATRIGDHVLPLADPRMLGAPFCYMAGHKLVEFNPEERRNFERYVKNGGFVLVDDCNHDINGLYAKTFEQEMRTIFPGSSTLARLPSRHALYRCFFQFPEGPPTTSHELNGWGDDVVHDYLRAVEHRGRVGVLYSNKDYGCEWDYDWRNKRFQREDNTKFAINIVVYCMTS